MEFNSKGSAVKLKCVTCGKIEWVKTEENLPEVTTENIVKFIESRNELVSYSYHIRRHEFDEDTGVVTRSPIEHTINIDVEIEPNIKSKSPTHRRKNIPSSVKQEVYRRDYGKCVQCGSNINLEYDHIIPVSKGGANTTRNIQLLCESCNRSKSAKIQ